MGDSGEYLERYLGDAYKGEFLETCRRCPHDRACPSSPASTASRRMTRWTDYAVARWRQAGAAALELNIFLQPTDRHRTAQELEQDYADVVRRVAELP